MVEYDGNSERDNLAKKMKGKEYFLSFFNENFACIFVQIVPFNVSSLILT